MSLTVFTGPMFSGKTTSMLAEITRFSDVSETRHALIINHSFDIRNIDHIISSHASMYKGLSSKIDVQSSNLLSQIDVTKYTIVGIDECNFFEDLVPMVSKWISQGKHIIASGLDGDYQMKKFGSISDLLPIADSFIKLKAICSCCLTEHQKNGGLVTPFTTVPAPFTKRISSSSSVIEIGGADKYVAVCRRHHDQ
jgi:thymidine kinase